MCAHEQAHRHAYLLLCKLRRPRRQEPWARPAPGVLFLARSWWREAGPLREMATLGLAGNTQDEPEKSFSAGNGESVIKKNHKEYFNATPKPIERVYNVQSWNHLRKKSKVESIFNLMYKINIHKCFPKSLHCPAPLCIIFMSSHHLPR